MTRRRPGKIDTETKAAFARRLGVHRSQVSRWAGRGMPTTRDGRVPIERALAWVERHVQPRADAGQATELAGDDTARQRYRQARAAHEAIKADRARLELRAARGELVEWRKVEAAFYADGRRHRDHMLALPARCSPEMAARLGVDPWRLEAVLHDAIEAELHRLADGSGPDG